ncbi:TIGR00266 family protein [Xenococcus sp. PCC 7305]|uniref:TIGR00266 family protein n=1 Tax=Xenococcus sp. PCC 7305 TaxID=102125 RepID=UPI0002AC6FD7|nr:TIGR00266 family protein [Xenococcus sp. PCC 7305]ELS04863.1 TIGR00266 family protein [Xenococcus sp. PCC 7305]
MKVELLQQPDSAIACVTLDAGEEVIAEAGSMIAMDATVSANTTLRQGRSGGIFGSVGRVLGGEYLFLSVFRSGKTGDEVWLAPKLVGDLLVYDMQGQDLIVQSGSYLACSSSVNIDLGFQGLRSLFSGESIFWLTISGYGKALITSFGGIYEIDVDGEYIVDTGHIVAFERSLSFSINKAGSSWLGAFLGGEGLVCHFRGQGKVYCQTHSPRAFGSFIGSRLPAR